MKNSLKILSLFSIFVAPIIIVIIRFSVTQETITVSSGLPLIANLIIFATIFVFFGFVHNMLKSKIRENPTGSLAITLYGSALLALLGAFYWLIFTIKQSAQLRYEQFITDLIFYQNTVILIISFVVFGIVLQFVKAWLEFKSE